MAAPTTSSPFCMSFFGVGFRKSHIRIAGIFSFFSGPAQTFRFTAGYYVVNM